MERTLDLYEYNYVWLVERIVSRVLEENAYIDGASLEGDHQNKNPIEESMNLKPEEMALSEDNGKGYTNSLSGDTKECLEPFTPSVLQEFLNTDFDSGCKSGSSLPERERAFAPHIINIVYHQCGIVVLDRVQKMISSHLLIDFIKVTEIAIGH